MDRFIKHVGVLTLTVGIGCGLFWIYTNYQVALGWFLGSIGLIAIIWRTFSYYSAKKYGKNWQMKAGLNIWFGPGLIDAGEQIFEDFENGKIRKQSFANFTAHVIWRITRIGLFGVLIAIVPTLILINQNKLLKGQNDLIVSQNSKIDIQSNLMEAERRGSLVMLMSNVLDQMNEEINDQRRDTLNKNPNANLDSVFYELSPPLIGRIAALSQGFRPYKTVQGDSLVEKELSIERGQLLLALVNSRLTPNTYRRIFDASPFRYSDLKEGNLEGVDLEGVDLEGADLRGADLRGGYLRGADLRGGYLQEAYLQEADLEEADLQKTNFRGANIREANIRGAHLEGADLQEADLYKAYLQLADLQKTNFRGADLQEANLQFANLKRAYLRGTYLYKANLHKANLNEANLQFARLQHAYLRGADLQGANLRRAFLYEANLQGADLRGADLRRAYLQKVFLYEANLQLADLREAELDNTKGLTKKQLLLTKSLYQIKGLDEELRAALEQEKPCLFKDPEGPSACED